MAHWPVQEGRTDIAGFVQDTTGSGAANTKGGWSQITAGLAYDVLSVSLRSRIIDATGDGLCDIGIGGAGSEQVLIPNVMSGGIKQLSGGGSNRGNVLMFPISIPRNTRISIRSQTTAAAAAVNASYEFNGAGLRRSDALGRVLDYGTDTANSKGTNVTSGNGVFGSWTQIAAATTLGIRYLGVIFATVSLTVGTEMAVQIGVGSAGNEKIVYAPTSTIIRPDNGVDPLCWGTYVSIPAGTRLSARINGNGNVFEIALYGVS